MDVLETLGIPESGPFYENGSSIFVAGWKVSVAMSLPQPAASTQPGAACRVNQ